MSEWISVEDELPKNAGDFVIACCLDYRPDGAAPIIIPARYFAETNSWFDIDNIDRDGEEIQVFQVTHWMPLPEPPK